MNDNNELLLIRYCWQRISCHSSARGRSSCNPEGIVKRFFIILLILISPSLLLAQNQAAGSQTAADSQTGAEMPLPIYQNGNENVVRLTNYELADADPQVRGGIIAWMENDGHDWEVMLDKNGGITQITHNPYNDNSPQISSDGQLAWFGFDGMDLEIYLYRDGTINKLTDNELPDQRPMFSGGLIVWDGFTTIGREIFLYDGKTVNQITSDNFNNHYPRISGSRIVWQSQGGGRYWINLYEGGQTTRIAGFVHIPHDNFRTQIDGDRIIWVDPSNDSLILYEKGSAEQISGDEWVSAPVLKGDRVAWVGSDLKMHEIFLYENGSTKRISRNDQWDIAPQLSGNDLVWQGSDGHDFEIFLYRDSAIYQITDNDFDDENPMVDSGTLVWQGNGEIYSFDTSLLSKPQ